MIIGQVWDIPENRIEYYYTLFKPKMMIEKEYIQIGRSLLIIEKNENEKVISKKRNELNFKNIYIYKTSFKNDGKSRCLYFNE